MVNSVEKRITECVGTGFKPTDMMRIAAFRKDSEKALLIKEIHSLGTEWNHQMSEEGRKKLLEILECIVRRL